MDLNRFLIKISDTFSENWKDFMEKIPDTTLGILIIAIGYIIANHLSNLFRRIISRKSKDPLTTNFLAKSVKVGIVILVIMFGLNTAGLSGVAAGVLTAAGASALIFGFAFRDIGENFISGIILSFNRPFKINDTIMIDDIFGLVKAMEFRYTKIKTFDGRDVYVPNSHIIKRAVYNYTEDGMIRLDFIVGVSYEDDVLEAQNLILNTVKSSPGVIDNEKYETFVAVDSLDPSTVSIKVYFWVSTHDYRREALQKKGVVIANVKNSLLEKGMHLPSDIKEIKFL
jgi:small conductance mechanosensitive channel